MTQMIDIDELTQRVDATGLHDVSLTVDTSRISNPRVRDLWGRLQKANDAVTLAEAAIYEALGLVAP